MEREAGETRKPAGVYRIDPRGKRGSEAVGEYLAEVANMSGCRLQFGAACEDLLQAGPVFLGQGRRVTGDG
jgi:hypothetical protein